MSNEYEYVCASAQISGAEVDATKVHVLVPLGGPLQGKRSINRVIPAGGLV